MSQDYKKTFPFPILFTHHNFLLMVRLALCSSVWTIIFSFLFWRLIEISKQAIKHLQRLHQIPCDKCVYFTGDYGLKCTVNPMVAMSEGAIGCRDFLHDNQRSMCNSCEHQCNDSKKLPKYSQLKAKFINLVK